jgi:hypothetical protein
MDCDEKIVFMSVDQQSKPRFYAIKKTEGSNATDYVVLLDGSLIYANDAGLFRNDLTLEVMLSSSSYSKIVQISHNKILCVQTTHGTEDRKCEVWSTDAWIIIKTLQCKISGGFEQSLTYLGANTLASVNYVYPYVELIDFEQNQVVYHKKYLDYDVASWMWRFDCIYDFYQSRVFRQKLLLAIKADNFRDALVVCVL